LFGGGGEDKQRYNTTYKFSIDKECLDKVKTFGIPPRPRTYHTANIIDSFMVIIGGETDLDTNDIYYLDLNTK